MSEDNNGALLSDIGEKGFVKLLLQTLHESGEIVGGRGNDATALDLGFSDRLLLLSVDRCPTPLAFQMNPSNFGVWGDLAITCTASDLLAAGAKPIGFLIALLLPRNLAVNEGVKIIQQAETLASSLGANIIAGDTKESSELAVITTGVGIAHKHRTIHRHGVKAGDLLVLTGQLGNFTAAHLAWKYYREQIEITSELLRPVLHPQPAYDSAQALFAKLTPDAGMDLSDGLLSTVFTLAEINGLGVTIKETSLPISREAAEVADKCSILPLRLAFGTGDWQIAYALDRNQWQSLTSDPILRKHVYPIGEFTEEVGVRLNCADGRIRTLRRIEQQHFTDSWADRGFLEYLLETPLFEE